MIEIRLQGLVWEVYGCVTGCERGSVLGVRRVSKAEEEEALDLTAICHTYSLVKISAR